MKAHSLVTPLRVLPVMLATVLVAVGQAQDATPEKLSPQAQQYRSIYAEYKAANTAIETELRMVTGEAKTQLREKRKRVPYTFAKRVLDIARQDPSHEDAYYPLMFCAVELDSGEHFDAALVILREHFVDHEFVHQIIPEVVAKDSREIDPFLRAVAAKGRGKRNQGEARFGLADRLKSRAGRSGDSESVKAAEVALQNVIATYPEVAGRGGSLKELAERELDDLCGPRGIGRVAPEVEGQDLDGKPFKLSEYRGKVVVLSFSGHWCGPCRAAHPHHQALIDKYAESPLALIEVNTDKDRDAVRRYMHEKNLTWRCFSDESTDGPISKAWGIHSWPRICVIDRKGVIRHKAIEPVPAELGKWVATLLNETE